MNINIELLQRERGNWLAVAVAEGDSLGSDAAVGYGIGREVAASAALANYFKRNPSDTTLALDPAPQAADTAVLPTHIRLLLEEAITAGRPCRVWGAKVNGDPITDRAIWPVSVNQEHVRFKDAKDDSFVKSFRLENISRVAY